MESKINNSLIKLFNDISGIFGAQLRKRLHKRGIRMGYLLLLNALADKDGVTQNELIAVTKFKAPSISVMLNVMENDNIIKREMDGQDRRAKRVFLTVKGKQMQKEINIIAEGIEKTIFSELTETEREITTELLKRIKSNAIKI